MTTTTIPRVHTQIGVGVDPATTDLVLAGLRAVCAPYPVDSLWVRIRRTGHPSMPTAVLTDVEVHLGTWSTQVLSVDPDPAGSVGRVCQRLAASLRREVPSRV
jgi:hypothetical protein